MIKNIYIQKTIAVFLLALFVISVTPVILIHDFTANHKDASAGLPKEPGTYLLKYKINCHCVDFVAESPFINSYFVYDLSIFNIPTRFRFSHNEDFTPEQHFLIFQRGPPASI